MNALPPERFHTERWMESVATKLCPPNGRAWVSAAFAEAAAAPGKWSQIAWLIGVVGLVTAVVRTNASLALSPIVQVGSIGAAVAGFALTAVAVSGAEFRGLDDDAFLTAALMADGAIVCAGAVLARRLYQ